MEYQVSKTDTILINLSILLKENYFAISHKKDIITLTKSVLLRDFVIITIIIIIM